MYIAKSDAVVRQFENVAELSKEHVAHSHPEFLQAAPCFCWEMTGRKDILISPGRPESCTA